MSKGKDYNRMIHSKKWLILRRDKLNAQPLCEECLKAKRLTPAREVHHARPVEWGKTAEERERRMFDPMNLVSLCRDCHHRIHAEMWAKRGRGMRRADELKGESQRGISALFGGHDPGERKPGGPFL